MSYSGLGLEVPPGQSVPVPEDFSLFIHNDDGLTTIRDKASFLAVLNDGTTPVTEPLKNEHFSETYSFNVAALAGGDDWAKAYLNEGFVLLMARPLADSTERVFWITKDPKFVAEQAPFSNPGSLVVVDGPAAIIEEAKFGPKVTTKKADISVPVVVVIAVVSVLALAMSGRKQK